ncbi:MAG: ferrous iron transport protein B [Deltaproteobacteria bacterium]|nr:ferrous iron transport protein B [Deltaproteobacteria bacterium]MBW1986151.1 ferrous iron transport protein B [Deltaproteobacteria bacterium]MBW2134905.1 ferrous iron transport protein B [Deltaproteobacteria bacterium]
MAELTICLGGNPNAGKTTVFNKLIGAHQKVGNWPGVTVEKKEGNYSYQGKSIRVVDLPGTYSLTAYSLDERIASDFLVKEQPDVSVAIVDASNLERNLYLVVELLELGANLVVDLNMMDLVRQKKWRLDVEQLSKSLGVPVVSTVANRCEGLEELQEAIAAAAKCQAQPLKIDYGPEVENALGQLTEDIQRVKDASINTPSRWLALKLLENNSQVKEWLQGWPQGEKILHKAEVLAADLGKLIADDPETYLIERRYGFINGLMKECLAKPLDLAERISLSDKIDKIVLNRWLGIPIFLLFMWLTFKLVFDLGSPLADYIDGGFGWLAEATKTGLGENWWASLLGDGIIAGVGSVLVFLPNILILFLMIGILEDSGYMARAAFVMDRFMHSLGLHGKSFIPMILGLGCNIPGIMACRTLESRKDRLLTILINPFMSCSARLPIYVLFAGAFFAHHAGAVIFILYVLGIIVAVLTALLFKSLFFKGQVAPLIMELPPYRMPTVKSVLLQMWQRASMFVKKAGTIILAGVILIWLLSSLPVGVEYASEQSWIGQLGKVFAPLFAPAGFGFWQAAVALVFGIVAKEVVVGTLGTLYGMEEEGLGKVLPQYFTGLSAFSFMVMSLLYIPCIASIGVIKAETNSWKWTGLAVGWSLLVGWASAVVIFQLGQLLI